MANPWALVTGATSGIGRATAVALAVRGYDLYLIGRRADRLDEAAQAVRQLGRQVRTAAFDIRDRAKLDEFIRDEGEKLTDVRVLINNAGLARGVDKVQNAKLTDWDEMIDTNVKALLAMTHAMLPFLMKRPDGADIVNIGSVAGRWTYPGGAVYAATKFAVRALSEGLRMDLLGKKIRVMNIEPGMVNTEFSRVRLGTQEAADRVYERMTPLSAEDIAESIVWCLERPKHVNIQELVIFPTDQAGVSHVHRE